MPRTFLENLTEYAKLAVRVGVNIQPGQELLISADVNDIPFVRLIVAEAYRAGAKNVQVLYSDEQSTLAKFQLGSVAAMAYVPTWLYDGIESSMNANAARLVVASGDPALLKDVDAARVGGYSRLQAKATENIGKLIGSFAVNWCIVGASSPAWSKVTFPNEPDHLAVGRLWQAIFAASRVNADDPIATWTAHQDALASRAAWLSDMNLTAVHFRGPGTDLEVGLAERTRWIGGWGQATNGVKCSPNIPTEEVFTVPHRERVNGRVSSTKPLSLRGQVIDGIRVEFTAGRVSKASASAGEASLLNLLETDEGASRLGEVALVPASSPIGASGNLFYNTLYDENAACHIALGSSIDECFHGNSGLSDEDRRALGGNESIVHVDWMIGSNEIDIDGVLPDGSKVSVMRSGEWAG